MTGRKGIRLGLVGQRNTGMVHVVRACVLTLAALWATGASAADFNVDFHRKYKEAQAERLLSARKYPQARQAFEELAATAGTPVEKAMWQGRAAIAAGVRKEGFKKGMEMAKAIEDKPYSIQARIELMSSKRDNQGLIQAFKDEDIAAWPPRPIPLRPRYGKEADARCCALFRRGEAFYKMRNGKAAAKDLEKAAELARNSRRKIDIWLTLAYVQSRLLKNEAQAFAAYMSIAELGGGSADYYRGVIGAADYLRKQGKYDEALDVLDKMNPYGQSGWWLGAGLLAMGQTLADAGKPEEAIPAYRKIVDGRSPHPYHLSAARLALGNLLTEAGRTAEAIAVYKRLTISKKSRPDDKAKAVKALRRIEKAAE